MNEPTLRQKTYRIQMVSIVTSVVALVTAGWVAAQFWYDHESRLARLEDFQQQGNRYTSDDALKDFTLRDQRIDNIELRVNEKFSEVSKKLDGIDAKLDRILFPSR